MSTASSFRAARARPAWPSLVTGARFDLEALVAHLEENLPSYARPIFLRFQQQIEATSTFKQRKVELQKQGFNPSLVADPIFVRDAETGRYSKLTPELYEDICAGKTKL